MKGKGERGTKFERDYLNLIKKFEFNFLEYVYYYVKYLKENIIIYNVPTITREREGVVERRMIAE